MLFRYFLIGILLLTQLAATPYQPSYPLRAKYPDVPVISTEQLNKEYHKVILIDVRSHYEYKVIHLKKAINNPVSYIHFVKRLLHTRGLDHSNKIVFYCNGETCAKSYLATQRAMQAGFTNVYAYDAGVFYWSTRYPELTVLMNQQPSDKNRLISKQKFKAHLIDYPQFLAKSKQANTVVIDVRDPVQRQRDIPLATMKLYLDRIEHRLKRGLWKNQTLLIYDAVGKQVRWLQYYLEKYGYKNYYFLNKGMLSVTTPKPGHPSNQLKATPAALHK